MEVAQEARAAGLAREQQLAAEVRSLRQQLAGRLPEGDPARALQVRRADVWQSGEVLPGHAGGQRCPCAPADPHPPVPQV